MTTVLNRTKRVVLESYVTAFAGDARRLRRRDHRGQPRNAARTDAEHVDAAVRWLCRAQDMARDGGVSAMFSLVEGWQGAYPETTGYIIPTLLKVAAPRSDLQLRQRCIDMADWLLRCQLPHGAFPGSFVGRISDPCVFNTGQILFGLLGIYEQTGQPHYLDAAERAGQWLLAGQDRDGAWRRHTFQRTPHVYNTRTAWALALLGRALGQSRYDDAARANAAWALTQQRPDGWLVNNAFTAGPGPATLHTIAYALQGLLEIGAHLNASVFIDAASLGAHALLDHWQRHRAISGAYTAGWRTAGSWRCLPGEAQLALVWSRLGQLLRSAPFTTAAGELLNEVKAAQCFDAANPDLDGGLSGALPIDGPYERYCLVSWGPKFLIDALLHHGSVQQEASHG